MDDEDTIEPDALDPFGAVYANVPDEGHMLKPVKIASSTTQRNLRPNH
jgi:hypothetical protein